MFTHFCPLLVNHPVSSHARVTSVKSSEDILTRNKLAVVSVPTPISARYGLLVEEATEYKAGVQPDIINSFASAAFRWESCCWLHLDLVLFQDQDGLSNQIRLNHHQDGLSNQIKLTHHQDGLSKQIKLNHHQDGLCSRFGHSMINSMFMLVSQRKPRNQVTKQAF